MISAPAIFEDLVGTGATETVDLRGTLRFNGVNRIVDLTEIRRNDSIARRRRSSTCRSTARIPRSRP